MMKQQLATLAALLCWAIPSLHAQSECLPQEYSFIVGDGLMLPHVDGNKNDFFNKNGNRPDYDLFVPDVMTEQDNS